MKPSVTNEQLLYEQVRELLVSARKTVARGVDLVQVRTNFEIGRHIFEHEQQGKDRADYGKRALKSLAGKLTQEFGAGFSETSLKLMRQFYLMYADRICQSASDQFSPLPISHTVSGESRAADSAARLPCLRPFSLSWSHYVFLLGVKNPDERSFYEIEANEQDWTLRELKRQFDTGLYERLALSRDKEDIRKLAQEGQIVSQPKDLLKEPLVLEFLGLSEQTRYSESLLHQAFSGKL